MAHAIDTRTDNPANALRDNLAEAERLIVNVDSAHVETLLVLLDKLDQQFDTLAEGDLDLRAEAGRWEGLQSRINRRPAGMVRAGKRAGGWNRLRARHAPATNFWWQLDQIFAARRNRLVMRTLLTIGGVIAGITLIFWAINTFFPPEPQAVLLLETNSQVSDRLALQDYDGAMKIVDEAQTLLADDPELIAWEVALAEQIGDDARADAASAHLRDSLADQPVIFWLTLSERRLAVGNLNGAEDAAYQAAAVDPENPRPYYLLANIAEFRGDYRVAIDLFEKTYELAEESAPDLAAISRVRMGSLMQSGSFAPPNPADDSAPPTPTP